MIPSYRDHAANERTFLAWIRTGITIMALGFVIERLDLLLASLGADAATKVPADPPQIHYLSVALVGVGVVLIGSATYSFNRNYRAILSEEEVPLKGTSLPTAMALVLLAVGIGLMLYLLRLL
jgi:putative membrane protein